MFIKRTLIFLVMITLGNVLIKAQNPSVPPEKPKLIVGIIISQMRYDYLSRYWNKFGEGGFKKLVNNGISCKNAHHDYLIAESGPGYASISTGAYPDVNGIVSDYWYDRLKNKITYCIESEKAATIGGNYDEGRYSPSMVMSRTLSDQLRIASQFNSRVISVSLDPKAAVLMGGHTANAAYWYDNQNGNWISSDYYVDSLSPWVNEINSKKLPDIYLNEIWQPVLPLSEYTESHPDNNTYETGFSGKITFPYDLKSMSSLRKNKKSYELLKYTPFGNTYTKDFAIASIVNENLGKDEFTDWLYISFSANSFIGKNFSIWSVEMEDTYIRLDKELEHLINFIDEQVGLKNVLIYLTAENAFAEDPSYLIDRGMPSGFFNYNNAMYLLRTYLNLIYGTGEWVKFYYAQQVYLNRQLIEDSKLSFNDFQDRVAGFMIQFEGVANALTANNLLTNNYTRGYFNKIQKSFNQKRSGDILLHLSQGWVEKGADTEYASSLRFDTHVPLVFYGWKVGRTIISRPVSVTDIMPSIAVLMDLSRPGSIEGNLIGELF